MAFFFSRLWSKTTFWGSFWQTLSRESLKRFQIITLSNNVGTRPQKVQGTNALIGVEDHSGEPQDWRKKVATVFRKEEGERKFNIFSPNYSVGTVLCTVECPGIGMAWLVDAGAKPHPPLIVPSVALCSALPRAHWQDLRPPLLLSLTAYSQPHPPLVKVKQLHWWTGRRAVWELNNGVWLNWETS